LSYERNQLFLDLERGLANQLHETFKQQQRMLSERSISIYEDDEVSTLNGHQKPHLYTHGQQMDGDGHSGDSTVQQVSTYSSLHPSIFESKNGHLQQLKRLKAAVFSYVQDNPDTKGREIARIFNISPTTANKWLNEAKRSTQPFGFHKR